ncbi:MAG TPA: multicopper oxidase domain-containing protein [Verrucomicrobiota bacterium]|nr:multicopper oxidase domain-containing protein [Verrucomicrobiota bacterium]
MKLSIFDANKRGLAAAAILLAALTGTSWAGISGTIGPNFTFTAKGGHISTSEGNSIYMWGYANGAGADAVMQYPGPVMIVNEDQPVKVTLFNELPVPVSIVFPAQPGVSASGAGAAGLLTLEVPAGAPGAPAGPVVYSFTPAEAGTYLYHSGTQWDLQGEMGLVGALIVRPTGFDPDTTAGRRAYAHPDSQYDVEYLYFLTDMDENIHDQVEIQVNNGDPVKVDMTKWYPQYWFMNGRSGTDTVLPAGAAWLPNQPYDALTMIRPTEKVLMRIVGAGRDPHPFHFHGNDALVIARDGRLLSSAPGAGADLGWEQFTNPAPPDSTWDQIFSWTGKGLGWDVYGHAPGDPPATNALGVIVEDMNDHGKPFPVTLPSEQDITYGQMYSGSPFIGATGALPPGEGGFNPGAFFYMWHSHNERELCDGNIFPGGMLTFAIILPHSTAP